MYHVMGFFLFSEGESLIANHKTNERQLLTVDLLARASMKNAAKCDT